MAFVRIPFSIHILGSGTPIFQSAFKGSGTPIFQSAFKGSGTPIFQSAFKGKGSGTPIDFNIVNKCAYVNHG